MHIALLMDAERLQSEQSMLNRLCIGLMSEGEQVTRVIPEESDSAMIDEGELRIGLAAKFTYARRVLPWQRRQRAERLADELDRPGPDLIYAVGEHAWALALDVGEILDRPVVIDLNRAEHVNLVPRSRGSSRILGYIAPTGPIADVLRKRVGDEMVSVVPTGISPPRDDLVRQALARDPDGAIAIAVLGRARDLPAYQAMFNGLAGIVGAPPAAADGGPRSVQVFLELKGSHDHDVWRIARRLDLLGCISSIADAAHFRPLLSTCDLLLLPERFGEMRTLLLDAMAMAVPIVASGDPYLDMIVVDQTAAVIGSKDGQDWGAHMRRLLTDRDAAARLGSAARTWVLSRHRSSEHVRRLIETFERALSGGSLRFARTPD